MLHLKTLVKVKAFKATKVATAIFLASRQIAVKVISPEELSTVLGSTKKEITRCYKQFKLLDSKNISGVPLTAVAKASRLCN